MTKERKFDSKQYIGGEDTAISYNPSRRPKMIVSFIGKAHRFRDFLEGLRVTVSRQKKPK